MLDKFVLIHWLIVTSPLTCVQFIRARAASQGIWDGNIVPLTELVVQIGRKHVFSFTPVYGANKSV